MPIKRNEIKERITDFSKARVGDKVFDRFRQEWGVVFVKENSDTKTFPIVVKFDFASRRYSIKGIYNIGDKIPALVWAEQKPKDDWSILPEMPKRMVKKKIEGWINVYPFYTNSFSVTILQETREDAIKARSKDALGEPLFISHEYEVEE